MPDYMFLLEAGSRRNSVRRDVARAGTLAPHLGFNVYSRRKPSAISLPVPRCAISIFHGGGAIPRRCAHET